MMNHEVAMSVSLAITLLGILGLYGSWRMLRAEVKLVKRRLAWTRKTNPRSYFDF
jgi:hypothetical protein